MKLQEKRDFYKSEINNIVAQAYNGEQKQLACDILDKATEDNIDALYTFITQRVKLGFTFDAAPEVNHNCVALCKRNNKLSFGILGNNHKMIIGENYDALKNLLVTYTKNGKGLIDVIYIDPPYNTEKSKEEGNDYKDNVEASKFIYRDKFTRNGWLNMMRERLIMARKLLSDKGVIFISIDDSEQAYLKVLCDEIFWEENFVAQIVWRKKYGGGKGSNFVIDLHEYILCYAKNKNILSEFSLERNEKQKEAFDKEDEYLTERGKYYTRPLKSGLEERKTLIYGIECPDGSKVKTQWICARSTFDELLNEGRIVFKKLNNGKYNVYKKFYENDKGGVVKPESLFYDIAYNQDGKEAIKKIFNIKEGRDVPFNNPKPTELIKYILNFSTSKDSIILDFFAGSGTTGQAVMELNEEDGGTRKCILVANNENNIGEKIMYERVYRVVNGKGTKGEKITWTYSKDKPYLAENSWDVFEMEYNELKIDDFDKAEKLLKQAELEFKNLNSEYEKKDLSIYNQLASLNPYKKDGK
jgi:adenine-specific DNA-methyltransferase